MPLQRRHSAYWSVVTVEALNDQLARSCDFPIRQLLPIAGPVAFCNVQVDVLGDDVLQTR